MNSDNSELTNLYIQRQRDWIHDLIGRVINMETQILSLNQRIVELEAMEQQFNDLQKEVIPLRKEAELVEQYRRKIQEIEVQRIKKTKGA